MAETLKEIMEIVLIYFGAYLILVKVCKYNRDNLTKKFQREAEEEARELAKQLQQLENQMVANPPIIRFGGKETPKYKPHRIIK